MSQSGGNTKAVLTPLEGGTTFTFQYNPTQFQVDKQVTWQESKTQGQDQSSKQYQKGDALSASFECVFDTTNSGKNVKTEWVDSLLALTNAIVTPKDGEPSDQTKHRPSKLQFQFGNFEMICVIESVSCTYTMFGADGGALRAKCQVKLKEWKDPNEQSTAFTAGGMSAGVTTAKLTMVSGGQTASQVAAANNMDTREFMALNNITDGMADLTGMTVITT
jgi:hypothetical protein